MKVLKLKENVAERNYLKKKRMKEYMKIFIRT